MMKENYKKFIDPNIKRKSNIIQNSLQFYKDNKIPLFSLVEISDSELVTGLVLFVQEVTKIDKKI